LTIACCGIRPALILHIIAASAQDVINPQMQPSKQSANPAGGEPLLAGQNSPGDTVVQLQITASLVLYPGLHPA
jgi:hypothetical protein